jgi:AraC family transcriptional regulator of adaptative response / DNA-3-methyladenine glycosylase II
MIASPPDHWHHAVNTRDPAFDGVFFVGIRGTRIYCRPICPSRLALPENRRFFDSAAAAESAGFRACKRCHPERAPGRASVDAVAVLGAEAARRIRAGALNETALPVLAQALGVSERHLRRAVIRVTGETPQALAMAQRLAAAERLLVETEQTVAQVAYQSGYRSLRRFNQAFRKAHGQTPTERRRLAKSPTS